MRLTKNQLKTWNSQQSDIDMFSKLQNNFLQKFFRLNLIDFFEDLLVNLPETQKFKKITSKTIKSLVNHLFRVQKTFMINQFEQKVHSFYKHKLKSFQSGQLQHAFKIRYCNWNPVPNLIKEGEFILFDVKIKAEIQKLQNIPQNLIEQLQVGCRNDRTIQDYQVVKRTFQNYNSEYFNLFIVYFGDINFHLVRKDKYEKQKIQIFGKTYKLRIFTFFVSKQALLEKFRLMNKINTLDHINDLVIQFYEVRREKRKIKQKKDKESSISYSQSQISKLKGLKEEYSEYFKYVVVGGVGIAAIFYLASSKFNSLLNG